MQKDESRNQSSEKQLEPVQLLEETLSGGVRVNAVRNNTTEQTEPTTSSSTELDAQQRRQQQQQQQQQCSHIYNNFQRFIPVLTTRMARVDYLMNILMTTGDDTQSDRKFFLIVAVEPQPVSQSFPPGPSLNNVDNHCHYFHDRDTGILFFTFYHNGTRYIYKQAAGNLPFLLDKDMKWALFGNSLQEHGRIDPNDNQGRKLHFPIKVTHSHPIIAPSTIG